MSMILGVSLVILLQASYDAFSESIPEYRNACGPISVWIAITSLEGESAPNLGQVVEEIRWEDGKLTSVQELVSFLKTRERLSCDAVRIGPDELMAWLRDDCVAILLVRKNSETVNHAVCAFRGSSGDILIYSYPELLRRISMSALVQIWDGDAVLVRAKPSFSFLIVSLCVIPSVVILWIMSKCFQRRNGVLLRLRGLY